MTDSVLYEERAAGRHRLGIATLNSPRKLNALDLDMIQSLDARLRAWAADPRIALVLLRGSGERAFCAGGDVRQVALAADHGDPELPARYFPAEYRLDHLIHTYPKPLLAWGEGIVMGGGLGLLAGAGLRVLTPRSLLAMPEITIGLFPDVGASWFLNRMPPGLGLYLGLTGARILPADALFLGLADQVLPDGSWETLLEALVADGWRGQPDHDLALLQRRLADLAEAPVADAPIRERAELIRRLTAPVRTMDIHGAILARTEGDAWLADNAARLEAGAPTSVFVIHQQLRRARHLSLADCFRMELDMAVQFCRRPDFREGVRALLIDKDNRPRWQPARLEDVTPDWVAGHFTSPWHGESPLADL